MVFDKQYAPAISMLRHFEQKGSGGKASASGKTSGAAEKTGKMVYFCPVLFAMLLLLSSLFSDVLSDLVQQ